MTKPGHQLADFLQRSYVDNSGKVHRVGKQFRHAIHIVGKPDQSGVKYCEPVQVVKRHVSKLGLEICCYDEKISVEKFTLENEAGIEIRCSFRYDALSRKIEIILARGLDTGYFYLNAELLVNHCKVLLKQLIICSPDVAWRGNKNETRNVLAIQLYALRSSTNWGIGDFGDLKRLAKKACNAGYCYIALNPMHMTHFSQTGECSPYSPISRLLLNWLYIDIAALDIFTNERTRLIDGWPFKGGLDDCISKLRSNSLVDYDNVAKVKFWVLNELAKCFWSAYECAEDSNSQHPLFSAFLQENQQRILGQVDAHCDAAQADKQIQQFHLFAQFCCQQQLQDCFPQDTGIQPIYDLAIGVTADSLEVRANPESYVASMSIGAPPDAFNQAGQCWNIAPFNPVALRDLFYLPLIELLQVNMPINGGIRIDHVMWLARQFWIVVGSLALNGAYVRFPLDEVLAILRLESARRNCVVIGEDLGTVPRGFRKLLTESGIFLMDVLPFSGLELDPRGKLKNYPEMVAAFIGTHDMPLFTAIWERKHAGILMDFDLISGREIADADAQVESQKLLFEKVIGDKQKIENSRCGFNLLNQKLRDRKPSFHFLLLDDVMGEVLPINIPGTIDEYPNWQRKHAVLIEDLELTCV